MIVVFVFKEQKLKRLAIKKYRKNVSRKIEQEQDQNISEQGIRTSIRTAGQVL